MFPSNFTNKKRKVIKEFTSVGASTWRVPSGVFEVELTLIGGQGGNGYDCTGFTQGHNTDNTPYDSFYNPAGRGGSSGVTYPGGSITSYGGTPGGFYNISVTILNSNSNTTDRVPANTATTGEFGEAITKSIPVKPGNTLNLFVGAGGVGATWDPSSYPGELYGAPGSPGKIIISYEV